MIFVVLYAIVNFLCSDPFSLRADLGRFLVLKTTMAQV